MNAAAPQRRHPEATSPLAQPQLVPGGGQLQVGNEAPAASPGRRRTPVKAAPAERVPFGSYLPADLHKQFKLLCVAEGIEMQDALTQAVTAWVAKHSKGH